MRIYKNRPPMEPSTTVWRYTSLAAVVAMIRESQLRLTRLDTFPDPFEESVPEKQMDDQVAIFGSHRASMMTCVAAHYSGIEVPQTRYDEPWGKMTRYRHAMTRSTHASCWRAGDDSEAMWRLYCKDRDVVGQGLALKSTLAKLEKSVAHHDPFVSPIRYRYYHEGPAFNDEMDAFMHKRKGFEHEQEVRVLKHDSAHYLALIGDSPPGELSQYIYIDWLLVNAIDAIIVSPYAGAAYEAEARQRIAAAEPSLVNRIELSVLSERRYAPNF